MIFDIVLTAALIFTGLLVLLNIFRLSKVINSRRKGKTIKLNKLKIGLNILYFIILSAIPCLVYANTRPEIQYSYPQTEGIWESYDKPVRVAFNIPIDSTKIHTNMNPEIKGRWEWKPYAGTSRLTKEGIFYTEETLFPNERVVIYITGISRIGIAESHEYGFVFQSAKLAEIIETTPRNNTAEIKQDQEIKLKLNKDMDNSFDLSFKFSPEIEFSTEYINSREILVKPEQELKMSTNYLLNVERKPKKININTKEIIDENNNELIHILSFRTQQEPLLRHIYPKGTGIKADSKIRIQFMAEMNQQSVQDFFSIEPSLKGTFKWDSSRTLNYLPSEALQKNTKYKISLKKGIKTATGITPTNELTHEFETIGIVKVRTITPENKSIKVKENTEITIRFDQTVNKKSAESNFRLSPKTPGTIRWDENTLIFKPDKPLSYETDYEIVMLAGVESIDGLDSTEDFSSKFKVRSNQVIIQMPLYFQPQYPVSFSCNIYAAKMALAWKGYNVSIQGIISEIGNDSRQDSNGRWLGNPHQVFVGNTDGSWGYGVYWEPVQKVFASRGIQTQIKTNWNVRELARTLEDGKPVVIWRYNGTSQDRNLQWGTGGVYAINGQHGGVVTGFKGTADNPVSFYINDPWFGLVWMDVNTFDYYWSRLNRAGLIIN